MVLLKPGRQTCPGLCLLHHLCRGDLFGLCFSLQRLSVGWGGGWRGAGTGGLAPFCIAFYIRLCQGFKSVFIYNLPWTEEPGRLQSMRLLRVGHDWATSLSLFTFMNWRRKWQPTPVFLPGESRGGEVWWAAVYGVEQSRTRLKRLSSEFSHHVCLSPFSLLCQGPGS